MYVRERDRGDRQRELTTAGNSGIILNVISVSVGGFQRNVRNSTETHLIACLTNTTEKLRNAYDLLPATIRNRGLVTKILVIKLYIILLQVLMELKAVLTVENTVDKLEGLNLSVMNVETILNHPVCLSNY